MTTTLIMKSRRAAVCAAVIGLALAPTATLEAQGAPPAGSAPRDSQPALRTPISPSRPPSTVAPRSSGRITPAARAVDVDASLRAPKSPSLPVDSVRPAPAPLNALDPRRAPALRQAAPPPPAPTARRPALLEQRAPAVSDVPPSGATARCKDGTWLFAPPTQASCAEHGGSAVVFPVRTTPPPPPRRP